MRLFVAFLLTSVFATAAPLFSGGRWNATIVLPAAPEPDEWYAAQTLVNFCERTTGVRPALRNEEPGRPVSGPAIYVGRTEAFVRLGRALPEVEGDHALRLTRRWGSSVYLVGNSPVATRIAVGRFCEQHLGVVFAFPTERGADYPVWREIALPEDDEFSPAFRWRGISGLGNELSAEWACSVGYGRVPPFSHGLYAAFGKREYAEDPTLFPMVNGVRTPPSGTGYDANPNLSHPRAPEIAARHARAWFHHQPGSFSVALGVNDTLQFDDSVPSEGWYRDRPVRTDYLVSFLNQVAGSFWEPSGDLEGRRHAIGTLAYLQTLAAPKQRVHPAVFPWVCADRSGYADDGFAATESANLRAWVRSGARRVGAYDYWYGADYPVPRVNFAAQASSIRVAKSAGVAGWIAELYPLWAFDAPKAWLGAKLLEDPLRDTETLLGQWFAAAYGPAREPMRDAYAIIEAAWRRDAVRGGRNQWIRHYRSEQSALVLSDMEFIAVGADLAIARERLGSAPAPDRLANQRWRFAQFMEAWELAAGFREVVKARRAQPTGELATRAALEQLTRSETDFRKAQQLFNLHWGAYGQPVRWAGLVPTNPRAEWVSRLRGAKAGDAMLAEWAPTDAHGLLEVALTPAVLAAHRADRWDFTGKSGAEARVLLSPASYARESRERGILHAVAPTGRVVAPAPRTVAPGTIVRFQARFSPPEIGHREASARVTLRFPGSKKLPFLSAQCGAGQGTVLAVAPEDASIVECEVSFENELALRSAELHLVPASALRAP